MYLIDALIDYINFRLIVLAIFEDLNLFKFQFYGIVILNKIRT